ncbi:hypothetical protein O6H91_08G072600 [Diphasiastrum complanatum]|uniref:Uncharacterized protein n=1 Tax=Diphasiastrum complanatum TaxID=34168 RepID=A0ACC2CYV0_DIPCM|nr:hypothetical protein O6H91_08G072600 [Diphasiastrum complanatum]
MCVRERERELLLGPTMNGCFFGNSGAMNRLLNVLINDQFRALFSYSSPRCSSFSPRPPSRSSAIVAEACGSANAST